MTTARLSLRAVVVRRGNRVVLHVPHLDLLSGYVLAVMGANGAGKSTLVQTLALLERPDAGQILFDGSPVAGRERAFRRRMAVVFQEPLLLDRSVRDNVRLGLQLRGVPRGESIERADTWLERLGIRHLAGRSAHHLSGGEAQRVSLARALVLQPDILLLDEPFTGLDAPSRSRLLADLAGLLAETRPATVFVTHDSDEARMVADHAAILVHGELRQAGPVADVFTHPADRDVAPLVGVETVAAGRIISCAAGVARLAVGSAVIESAGEARGRDMYVCIRPEDVEVLPPPFTRTGSESNYFLGTVQGVAMRGGQWRLEIDCGFPLVALVSPRTLANQRPAPGTAVTVSVARDAVHLVPVEGGGGYASRVELPSPLTR